MNYPESFSNLLESFKKLPGIGEKTAERFLYKILEMDESEVKEFSENLLLCKNKIKKCEICGHYTENKICDICSNKDRKENIICIVEDSKNVFAFEKIGNYKGKYHVLGGLISPINGINPEDINLDSLINYRINDKTEEIILALNPSLEGETTSLYIQKILESNDKLKISRLSYGIPMGTDIEYLDPMIIEKALEDRKIIS